MLNKLTLKNFRKCDDIVMHFNPGLNAVRGRNEAGKSTRLEAIAYALFGSKALRQSLDEVVSWGKPVNTLKVELEFTYSGTTYTVTRGKSGAEINFDGEKITGQTETVKFIERLLGTSADTAGKLMLATQNSIRGALEGGPKETMALIENLADFDLIDRIITLIQTNLPSGNTTAVEERVKTTAGMLEEKRAGVEAEKPDTAAIEAEISTKALQAETAAAAVESAKQGRAAMAAEVTAAEKFIAAKSQLPAQIKQAQVRIDQAAAAARRLSEEALCEVSDEQIEEARAGVEMNSQLATRIRAYNEVMALVYPEDVWDEDEDSFHAFVAGERKKAGDAGNKSAEITGEIRAQSALKITQSACGLCGKDLEKVPEVVEKNAAIETNLKALEAERGQLAVVVQEARENLAACEAIAAAARKIHPVIDRNAAYVEVDRSQYPARAKWKGERPDAGAVRDWAAELRRMEQQVKAAQLAQGRLAAVEEGLSKHEAELVALEADWKDAEPQIMEFEQGLLFTYRETVAAEQTALESKRQADSALQRLRGQLAQAEAVYKERLKAVDLLAQQLAGAKAELEQMNFHNALIKKIRAARPVIADKLWNVVLAAVSHYFSQIRGTSSTVTRADNGFKVDGQAVEGLSGSTLDALGLAIRISLTKTFLPNSRFILLDEPGHGMDDQRESAMLGVLAAADFDQTVIVSHNETVDSFADHLIAV
ncbi:AAA family ATPase [Cupriavidus necator]